MNIGEAARRTGLSPRAIRHYEAAGVIGPPARSDAGYRDFSEDDIRTLCFVRNARALGFDLETVRQLLAHWRDGATGAGGIDALLRRRAQELAGEERALRESREAVERLHALAAGSADPGGSLVALLAGPEFAAAPQRSSKPSITRSMSPNRTSSIRKRSTLRTSPKVSLKS